MKKPFLLVAMGTLFNLPASNAESFWFSNKTEIGYGPIFIAEQIKVENGILTSNTISAGAKIKVNQSLKLQTFYLIKQNRKDAWCPSYATGLRLDLTFPLQNKP